jgi:hypothetical protein
MMRDVREREREVQRLQGGERERERAVMWRVVASVFYMDHEAS